MKKELIYYSTFAIVISSLLFFEIRNNNQNYSKVIDVEVFDKLSVDLACNIYVSIGDEQKLVAEGPENYLDLIDVKLENGTLIITEKKVGVLSGLFGQKIANPEDLNLYIKLTDVCQLVPPKKGNLISNEASLYLEIDKDEIMSNDQGLKEILKMLTGQLGFIKII